MLFFLPLNDQRFPRTSVVEIVEEFVVWKVTLCTEEIVFLFIIALGNYIYIYITFSVATLGIAALSSMHS